jgi:hypothetical protein
MRRFALASVDEGVLNASHPKSFHCGSQSLQKPLEEIESQLAFTPQRQCLPDDRQVAVHRLLGPKLDFTQTPSQGQSQMSTLMLSSGYSSLPLGDG